MMRRLILLCTLTLFVFGCSMESPTAPTSWTLASCNGKPPGQQPSGNPAQAPGNSSSNDHDCKTGQ